MYTGSTTKHRVMTNKDKTDIVLRIVGLSIRHDKFTTFTILSTEYRELDYDFVSMAYDLVKDHNVTTVQLMNEVKRYESRVEGIKSD